MKHRNIIKVLSVTLAILAAVMLLPFGTLVAYAVNDEEQMGGLSTAETVTNGQDFEAQVIETEMETEIVCEDDGDESSKSPQASKDGEPQSTRSTQITTTGYIPDGVYALRNVANQNFWMDVQDDSIYPTAYIQQSSYSSNPADTFDRPALFKISRIPNTSRYVIRLMTNNRLSFYGTADKEAATMEISPRDTEVPINNTFYITYDSTGYVIQPYNSSSYVLGAQNTTSGGESAYPYSKLKFVSKIASDNKARWQLYQYTGTAQSGTVISRTAGMGNGIVKGQSGTIWLKTWSTVIGVNTPYLSINSAYSNIASLTWNASTYSATVTGLVAGDLPITAHTRYDGTQTDYRTSTYKHVVIPDIVEDTAYVQNGATGKHMEVESASTANGGIVQQWSFHTQPQMKWVFELGGGGFFKIKNVNSGKYLGVDSSDTTKVKQYSSVTDYTLWKISETSSGNYKFACKALESSGKVLSTPASTSGNGVDLTMLIYGDNSSYTDEWKIKTLLPTSGSEVEYNTSLWNYWPVVEKTNCYAYSLNNQVVPGTNILWYMQPGEISGYTLSSSNLNGTTVVAFVEKDATTLGFTFTPISKSDQCSSGTYKVALVISQSPRKDYHWYRQNPDGTWSHKLGGSAVVNTDASGNIIFDPELADRNYSYVNYSTFVGFFKVTPLNNMYSSSKMMEKYSTNDNSDMVRLDSNKNDLPSYQNALSICKGMRYSEVANFIGHPQRVVTFGLLVVEYELDDGNSIFIEYVKGDEGGYVVEHIELSLPEEE